MANIKFNGAGNAFVADTSLGFDSGDENPIRISYASNLTIIPQVESLRLGDGYQQLTMSGVRRVERKVQLTFKKVSDLISAALQSFFVGSDDDSSPYYRMPNEHFILTLPDQLGGQTLKWVVLKEDPIDVAPVSFNATTITVRITEVTASAA